MKNLITIAAITLLLTGCVWDGPIKNPFPTPPEQVMVAPRPLAIIGTPEETAKIAVTDTTPSGVPLSVVVKSVTTNYNACLLNTEQLISLQSWVTEQKKLNK